MPEHFDVIIIGTGAGGGTLAHTLASSGKKVLLLERGDFLPREMENWSPDDVFIDGRYISEDTWYDGDGTAFQPQVHYFVGGATKLYGAALYRLRPEDFGEISHVDGVSPGLAGRLRRVRALLHQGGAALPGPRDPRRGPHRRAVLRAVPRPARQPRAPAAGDLRRPHAPRGTTPSRLRAASSSTSPTATAASASAARGVTATPAWSTPRPTPRSWPSGPASSRRTSPC